MSDVDLLTARYRIGSKLPDKRGAQTMKLDEKGDLYFEEIISNDMPPKVKRVEPCERDPPLVKELEASVIIKRSYYSPTGEPRTFFGLQKLHMKIPQGEDYRYFYLCYKPSVMQTVNLVIVDPDRMMLTSRTLALRAREKRALENRITKKVGKPKKLTENQVRYLIREKKTLGVMNDDFLEEQV
jgi:hypothetical protein